MAKLSTAQILMLERLTTEGDKSISTLHTSTAKALIVAGYAAHCWDNAQLSVTYAGVKALCVCYLTEYNGDVLGGVQSLLSTYRSNVENGRIVAL